MVTVQEADGISEAELDRYAKNPLLQEILLLGQSASIIFIHHCKGNGAAAACEGEKVSCMAFVIETVKNKVAFLCSRQSDVGQAVLSVVLEDWYEESIAALDRESRSRPFAFDPTLILAGILKSLAETLQTVNNFVLPMESEDPHTFIPMKFIRDWECDLLRRLDGPERFEVVKQWLWKK